MSSRPWIALALLAVFGSSSRAEEGFVPLVEGDDPKPFEFVAIGPDTIQIADGEVHVSGRPERLFRDEKVLPVITVLNSPGDTSGPRG